MKRAVIFVFLFSLFINFPAFALTEGEDVMPVTERYTGVVTHVYDADEIEINGAHLILLGVAAPDRGLSGKPKDCYSEDSTKFLEEIVLNQEISYSYDPLYGRHGKRGIPSVYVYIADRLINGEMIENGYAFADLSKKYVEKEKFLKLEADAKFNGFHIWHTCPVECFPEKSCRVRNW